MAIKNDSIIIPNPVMRYEIADYLGVEGTYELMGLGFESLNESPNAQSNSKTYINQRSQSSFIKSYQREFPYSADMIKSEKALMALYDVNRHNYTGADAMFEYVRVDLYDPVKEAAAEGQTATPSTTKFKARKFIVSCEVSSNEGNGGEAMTTSGTLKAFGDPVEGVFDIKEKKFLEESESAGSAGSDTTE